VGYVIGYLHQVGFIFIGGYSLSYDLDGNCIQVDSYLISILYDAKINAITNLGL